MLRSGLLLLGCLLSLQVAAIEPAALVSGAREQIGVTLSYDPAYRRIAYPGASPIPAATCRWRPACAPMW